MADSILKTPLVTKKTPVAQASAAQPSASRPLARQFAGKAQKPKRSDFQRLVDSAGFVLLMGVLVGASGLVLLEAFRNHIAMYFLDIGLVLCLYSVAIKFLDICLKLMGVRS